MINVLIADGNARLGHVMAQLLDDDHRFHVVGVVTEAEAARQAAAQHAPDVVLVAQRLASSTGAQVCAQLRPIVPDAVLLLWSHEPTDSTQHSRDADGLIERGMTYRELARAIRDAHGRAREPRVLDLTERQAAVRRS